MQSFLNLLHFSHKLLILFLELSCHVFILFRQFSFQGKKSTFHSCALSHLERFLFDLCSLWRIEGFLSNLDLQFLDFFDELRNDLLLNLISLLMILVLVLKLLNNVFKSSVSLEQVIDSIVFFFEKKGVRFHILLC